MLSLSLYFWREFQLIMTSIFDDSSLLSYQNTNQPQISYSTIYIFIYLEKVSTWRPLLMIALYHRIKIPINLRYLIQLLEILSVELTETHCIYKMWNTCNSNSKEICNSYFLIRVITLKINDKNAKLIL